MTRNPSCRGGGQDHGHAVGERDRLRVRGPVRRGQQHLVARVEQGLERVVDRVLAAVGDDHLLRLDDVAGVAGGLRRDRGAQLGQPAGAACSADRETLPHAAIAASTMRAGVGKSGSPAPKPMTSSPAAWQRLRLGVDRQRGRLGDGADATRDPAHAPMVARTTRHDPHVLAATTPAAAAGSQFARSARPRIVGEHLDHRDLQPETALDDAGVVLLVPELQRDRDAALPRARGATRAVQVRLVVLGRVVVHDDVDRVDVDAARGDVGGDEHRHLAAR